MSDDDVIMLDSSDDEKEPQKKNPVKKKVLPPKPAPPPKPVQPGKGKPPTVVDKAYLQKLKNSMPDELKKKLPIAKTPLLVPFSSTPKTIPIQNRTAKVTQSNPNLIDSTIFLKNLINQVNSSSFGLSNVKVSKVPSVQNSRNVGMKISRPVVINNGLTKPINIVNSMTAVNAPVSHINKRMVVKNNVVTATKINNMSNIRMAKIAGNANRNNGRVILNAGLMNSAPRVINRNNANPLMWHKIQGSPVIDDKTFKEKTSERCLNALPPGITITRKKTSEEKVVVASEPDVVIKKGSQLINPFAMKTQTIIDTVELDNDGESPETVDNTNLEDDNEQIEIPIEYNAEESEKRVSPVEIEVERFPDSTTTDITVTETAHNVLTIEITDSPVKSREADTKEKLERNLISKGIEGVASITKDGESHNVNSEGNAESPGDIERDVNTKDGGLIGNGDNVGDVIAVDDFSTPVKDVKEVAVCLGSREDKKNIERHLKKLGSAKKRLKFSKADLPDVPINETYQKFIDLCLRLDNSDEMKMIIEKKIVGYYKAVSSEFTSSKSFIRMVEDKVKEITDGPERMFLYIKDIVDELKVRRIKVKKSSKSLPIETEPEPSTSAQSLKPSQEASKVAVEEVSEGKEAEEGQAEEGGEEEEVADDKTTLRILRLEKALRQLSKAIQKLEEKEVDYDEEQDSAYLLADRYKSRLVRVYQKLCTLTGERPSTQPVGHALGRLALRGGRLQRLAAAVRAVAARRPHWFPDYPEVLECVKKCAADEGIKMRRDELEREAREAFIEIGTVLQRRRKEQEYDDLSWSLGTATDPADSDPALAAKLQRNHEIGSHREMDIINKYAEKQTTLKLVPEIVPDDQAEGSEDSSKESDTDQEAKDEDSSEKNSLKNSEATVSDNENSNSRENLTPADDGNQEDDVVEETSNLDAGSLQILNCTSLAKPKSVDFIDCDDDSNNRNLDIIAENVKKSKKRKRFLDDEISDSDLSLIELSSNVSDDDSEDDGEYKHLNKRPCSVMSGVESMKNDDDNDVMNVDDSNDGTRMSGGDVTNVDDSNDAETMDETLVADENGVVMNVDDSNDAETVKAVDNDVINDVTNLDDSNDAETVNEALDTVNNGVVTNFDDVVDAKNDETNDGSRIRIDGNDVTNIEDSNDACDADKTIVDKNDDAQIHDVNEIDDENEKLMEMEGEESSGDAQNVDEVRNVNGDETNNETVGGGFSVEDILDEIFCDTQKDANLVANFHTDSIASDTLLSKLKDC